MKSCSDPNLVSEVDQDLAVLWTFEFEIAHLLLHHPGISAGSPRTIDQGFADIGEQLLVQRGQILGERPLHSG